MILTKINRLFSSGIALCIALLFSQFSFSQSKIDSLLGKLDPQNFAASVAGKAKKLEDKLVTKSMNVLDKLQRDEGKLYTKMLAGKDSLIAKSKLVEIKGKYDELKNNLKNPTILSKEKQYIPMLDSLNTTLKFLNANGVGGKVKDALAKTSSLQDKFQQAEEIKKFIRERKEQLKQQLENLGMMKQLKKINKQVYYYAAQINEYKEILNDPRKIEKKAMELLSKTKLFKEFMTKNSMLASFFPMPGVSLSGQIAQAGFAGLQTRSEVLSFIQNQSGMNIPSFASVIQKNIQSAQGVVNQLRNKLNSLGLNSGGDLDMPDFKPNNQKTKSFKKRLEIGTNLQTQKSNNFFPTTTDLGLSVGYKLNDKSIIGIGSSLKMGWGKNIQHIKISGEGLSLRSFMEVKVKNSFYASGGFEYNYQEPFTELRTLYDLASWKKSALLGVSKVVSLKGGFLKKAKLQLLYDFLYRQELPLTTPLKFRMAYVF